MIHRPSHSSQRGFTIIELMIATTVLSTILVLVTTMMISIGNLFYKGVTQARVQNNTRFITDDLSQRLQLTDSQVLPQTSANYSGLRVNAVCIGPTRYSYIIGSQQGSDPTPPNKQVKHVLWRDTGDSSCTPLDITQQSSFGSSSDGTDMVIDGARLTSFGIYGSSPYIVKVGVAYGDYDLLTSPYIDDSASAYKVHCLGGTSGRFCATASLSTTVVKRITSE